MTGFMLREIPLEVINPFDGIHVPDGDWFKCASDEDTREHQEGIEYVRGLMRHGKIIRPILVTPLPGHTHYKYQRLDGFKRYFAYKLEGRKTIGCVVIDEHKPGGQYGMSMVINGCG